MSAHEVEIVPYQDGPYLVRGPVSLRDQDGQTIDAGRRTIALCRCGKSRMRPFCDGTHQLIRFKAPSGPERKRRFGSGSSPLTADVKAGHPASSANGSINKGLQDVIADTRDLAGADDPLMHAASLIRETIATLVHAAGSTDRDVPKVIEQLSVLVGQLEAQGGRA